MPPSSPQALVACRQNFLGAGPLGRPCEKEALVARQVGKEKAEQLSQNLIYMQKVLPILLFLSMLLQAPGAFGGRSGKSAESGVTASVRGRCIGVGGRLRSHGVLIARHVSRHRRDAAATLASMFRCSRRLRRVATTGVPRVFPAMCARQVSQ